MMVALFGILLLAVLFAWAGFRFAAQSIFAVNLVLAVIWFHHHVTSKLTIQL